jgi:hypothetical protein
MSLSIADSWKNGAAAMSETPSKLFTSVPERDYSGIFHDGGNPKTQKIPELLGYRPKDVSAETSIPPSTATLRPGYSSE